VSTILKSEAVPTFEFDPYSTEFLTDPYPYHVQLREAGPVARLGRYGVWAVARHAVVHSTLNQWSSFSSAAGVGLADFRREVPWRKPSLLLETDPPAHAQNRAVITRVLSRSRINGLRVDFEAAADALISDLLDRRELDAICDVAQAYPLKVFPDAMGTEVEGRQNLLLYGDMVFNAFGPRNDRFDVAMKRIELVGDWVKQHCRSASLRAGGIGAEVFSEAQSRGLSTDEAELLVRSLLSAGVDTTVSALSGALVNLVRNSDQWRLLHDSPALARAAFEESVRFESPVQTFFRTTTDLVKIEDQKIPAGEKILMFLGAANRDPRRWPEADRYDIRRNTTGHVGFGAGIHACVGQMIARLEGEVLLSALARRVRAIEPLAEPQLHLNNTLRTWDHFKVRLHPC
jgi:4-methoxybenzoate monooxygenase (O-demethylating)